jgi:hypothetical protein
MAARPPGDAPSHPGQWFSQQRGKELAAASMELVKRHGWNQVAGMALDKCVS